MFEKSSHSEWLSLLEISGPFLAEPVLEAHFPQGLDGLDPSKKRRLRQAYEEWREAQDNGDSEFEAFHQAWTELVLKEGLELDEDDDADVLKPANNIKGLSFEVPEHDVTISPDYAVITGSDQPPSLLIQTLLADVDLEAVDKADGYAASPVERMVKLCRARNVRLGLLTNGERWMLIDAPEGGVTSYASWYARLWSQEPVTLQAFVNLLGIRRFFLDPSQQLPTLLDESVKHQDEVTDALGGQVSRAVEVLIQALDKADQDKGRELLKGIEPSELYEAGLTVMMRLVFLLSAEERGLLLLGDERYEAYYAVSSLRMQLREQAGLHSEEILSHRRDAWSRLLAIFRGVYGGIGHESLRMPALGGSLFDPDRFPFLEGRAKDSYWRYDRAQPLPIDNRTVLLLLDAIQLFQGRTLSYRALDVEQIGYVYEGLLERTVIRASDITLEVSATKSSTKPWITWGELENARLNSDEAVKALLKERSGSSESRINNDLSKSVSDAEKEKLLVVCQGDSSLRERLAPFYHFLRIDPWGYPLIYLKGSFMVSKGSDRRETGSHYTPKALTEAIVKETLEPLAYAGPSDGLERSDWVLKTSAELLELKVCDLAMGSGAFLVQACRWLSERLIEAWRQAEAQGGRVTADGGVVEQLGDSEPLSNDEEERLITARRLIAERCLYGVDFNPLAVELAKLSIWLITLARGRPFGFLDHNLRYGDSLLGIVDLDQLHYLDLKPGEGSGRMLFAQRIDQAVQDALELRKELRARPIRDIRDVEAMAGLDERARRRVELPGIIADALIGEVLAAGGKEVNVASLSIEAGNALEGDEESAQRLMRRAHVSLSTDVPAGKPMRRPFHWVLEFPEVFSRESGGFDAIVGNPPFLGDTSIRGVSGKKYRDYLLKRVACVHSGKSDLVVYFFLNAFRLISSSGYLGLLATDSLSRGDTRDTGLKRIIEAGGVIYSAVPSIKWPGKASIIVHRVHIAKSWSGVARLNGIVVKKISSGLTSQAGWHPVKLISNLKMVFEGVQPNGEGFIIDDSVAKALLQNGESYQKVVFPYLIAKRLNQDPPSRLGKWIINFWDWDYEEASSYPSCMEILEKEVKPVRQRIDEKTGDYALEKKLVENWWTFKRPRPELFFRIGRGSLFKKKFNQKYAKREFGKVIVFARGATKYPSFSLIDNDKIYGDSLCVIANESKSLFAVLSSDIHAIWAWEYGARKTFDLRYIQEKVFETFPFPDGVLSDKHQNLSQIGERYLKARMRYMVDYDKGMTNFYNDLHDASVATDSINAVRQLQAELNQAVMEAYGFNDVDLGQDFHGVAYLPLGKNIRFTISEAAREDILHRLAILNKRRHEEEQRGETRSISNKVDFRSKGKNRIEYDKGPVRGRSLDKVAEPKAPQMGLFETEETGNSPGPRTGNQWGSNAVDQIYGWLESNEGRWFSKEAIMAGCGANEMDWSEAIDELISDGDLEKKRDGDTIRYRAVI